MHYDATVRDHDGSIIQVSLFQSFCMFFFQFRYGEDGFDTCKASFLRPESFSFLKDNHDAVENSCRPSLVKDRDFNVDKAEKQFKKVTLL